MKRKVLSICVCTIICILSNACSFGYKESDGIKTTESISETEELETSKTTEEAADITQPKYPIQINETDINLKKICQVVRMSVDHDGYTHKVDISSFPMAYFLSYSDIDNFETEPQNIFYEDVKEDITFHDIILGDGGSYRAGTMTPEYADQLIAWYGADTGNYDEYDANDDDDMATYVAAWEDENYDIEHIEVDEIEQVTDTSVRIIGKIEYEPDGMSETDTEMNSFIIEATINPESIFGGYTFNTMYIFDTEEVANDYFKLEEDSWKKLYIDFLFDNILEDNGNTYLGSSGLVQNNKNYFLWDVTGNGVPELFMQDKWSSLNKISVYRIIDQEIVEIPHTIRDYLSSFGVVDSYEPYYSETLEKLCFCGYHDGTGGFCDWYDVWSFEENKMEVIDSIMDGTTFSAEDYIHSYFRLRNEITKEEYDEIYDSWRTDNWTSIPVYDSIDYVFDALDVQNNFYDSNEYKCPDSNVRYLTDADLESFSKEDCKIARNEIYARHGRKFNDEFLQEYFNSSSRYNGTIEPDNISDDVLIHYEKANLELIISYENRP